MSAAVSCDQTQSWQRLQERFEAVGRGFDLRQAFARDPHRFEHFSQDAPHVFVDLSKSLLDRETESLLFQLARERGLEDMREAMFLGAKINRTEDRSVLHTLLRAPAVAPPGELPDVLAQQRAQVQEALRNMLDYAEQVRSDAALKDIVSIGIGGSDLGPQMAVQALQPGASRGPRFHFVSNVDGHELSAVLESLRPESTLFLIASKTFTTAETMTNAGSARRWFLDQGGVDLARHFVALTSNPDAARAFGIETSFGFWDWVGGRYSMWSVIGLPIALAVGAAGFRELLEGAHAMDEHFRQAPLEENLPARLALLDVWYRNFHDFASRCLAPYHSGLRRLPAYLQQLEMESNGKRVDMAGREVNIGTAPVLWGETGTNGQHAYFQLLHQGSDVVPVEFLVVRTAKHELAGHHDMLLANALAQARALMLGKADAGGHRNFPGNRPSLFFIIEKLEPRCLGALIALYEHRVFVSGAIWGINSFDQWGVELGKTMAQDLQSRLLSLDTHGLDPSTTGLIGRLASTEGR